MAETAQLTEGSFLKHNIRKKTNLCDLWGMFPVVCIGIYPGTDIYTSAIFQLLSLTFYMNVNQFKIYHNFLTA